LITFAQPIWILIGAGICIGLAFLLRQLQKQRTDRLARFAAAKLLKGLTRNVSTRRRLLKNSLILAALFSCFIALARPQYGSKWIDVKRKGIDILFAIDTSKSMLVQDIKPNRLARAKLGIMDFVARLDGDRVGLLPFAGSAYLMCPLTMDYNAFEQSLSAVNTTIIPTPGTDLGTAIDEAETVLNNQANHKILILITDGENLAGDALKTAAKAHENGMTIFTVGVGTSEGELIPDSAKGGSHYKKDTAGKFITSKLDETTLKHMSEAGGGIYAPLGNSGQGLATIYEKKLSLIPKEELAEKRTKVPLERFEWPLLAALVFLMIEFVVSGRKSSRSIRVPFIKSGGRREKKTVVKTLLIGFALISFGLADNSYSSPGEEAYAAGDFIGASQIYSKLLEQEPDNPKYHFNYGTAAYKNNLFDDAINSFNQALQTDDLDLQARAYYNKGNAQFKKGEETAQTDPKQTIQSYQSAIEAYDASLALKKDDQNGLFNRELVKKKLEELQKQQEKQQEQQNQDKKDNEKDQKQEEKQEEGDQKDQQQDDKQSENDKQKPGDRQEEKKESKSDSEMNKEEKQDSAKENGNNEEPTKAEKSENDKKSKADQAAKAAAADQQRRQLGKMTREEAEQLLNSLKQDESELNFVPTGAAPTNSEPGRDW